MDKESNVYEKILCVQQRLASRRPTQGSESERLAALLRDVMPHLNRMKLALTFSEDVEERGGELLVRCTATVSNTEAPYDRTAATAYEPMRDGSVFSRIRPDVASLARRKALTGLFALGDEKAPDDGAGRSKKRRKKSRVFKGERDEKKERALSKAKAVEVTVPSRGGSRKMALGDMSEKQLRWAKERYAKCEDVARAIETVERAKGG